MAVCNGGPRGPARGWRVRVVTAAAALAGCLAVTLAVTQSGASDDLASDSLVVPATEATSLPSLGAPVMARAEPSAVPSGTVLPPQPAATSTPTGPGSDESVEQGSHGDGWSGAVEAPHGFPTLSTTGVPAGAELTPSESLTITEDGTVVDGLHVKGVITVDADDVVIRRTLVDNTGRYPIKVESDVRNLLVEDVEIDGNGLASVAILRDNYTLRRVDIHDVRDGPRIEGPDVVIEDSYIHHLTRTDGGHHDAIQIRQGTNLVIRGNNLQAYHPEQDDSMNAAIQVGSLTGELTGMLVEGNLMNGGNYTINPGGDWVESEYRANVFQRDYQYGVVSGLGDRTTWHSSNVWADTGEPVVP